MPGASVECDPQQANQSPGSQGIDQHGHQGRHFDYRAHRRKVLEQQAKRREEDSRDAVDKLSESGLGTGSQDSQHDGNADQGLQTAGDQPDDLGRLSQCLPSAPVLGAL